MITNDPTFPEHRRLLATGLRATLVLGLGMMAVDAEPVTPSNEAAPAPAVEQGERVDIQQVWPRYQEMLKQYEGSEDPRHLQLAWQELKGMVERGTISGDGRDRVLDEMLRLLPQMPRSQAVDWLVDRFRSEPDAGADLVRRIGSGRTMTELRRDNVSQSERGNVLLLLEMAADALIQARPDGEDARDRGLTLLAERWLLEADHALVVELDKAGKAKEKYFNEERYRYSPGPEALSFRLIYQTAPRGSWIESVRPDTRQRIEMTLARLAMRRHKAYDEEVQDTILRIARTDPRRAGNLAEEYLGCWSRHHNPGLFIRISPDPFGHKEMGIPLTSSKQKANLSFLRDFAKEMQDHGVALSQSDAFLQAFIQSHAITEVFQPRDIEAVFGPLDGMSTRQIVGLTRAMQIRLGEQWRSEKANKELLTMRGPGDIVNSVMTGYETAADMLKTACGNHPDDWELHAFRGSLLHDKARYAYSNNRNREEFCAARDEAIDCFSTAGWAYLLTLPDTLPAQRSIEPFVAWLNVILGSSDLAALSVEVMPDLGGHTPESRLRDLRRLLEAAAFIEELKDRKLTPGQLRAAVGEEQAEAERIDRAVWRLRGRVADERTPLHQVTPAMLRSLKLTAEEKSLVDAYEQLEQRRKASFFLRWHLEALCEYLERVLPELPAHMRQRYLSSGLKVIDKAGWPELPEGQLVRGLIADYEDALTEIRLAVEVDGSNLIDPDGSFGMMVKLQFTEEVEASTGGFSRYLVNENTESQYAGRSGIVLVDYRDNLERRIRNALEDDFHVEHIVFEKTRNAVRDIPQAKEPENRETGERRWREQAFAYVVARPVDAAVDWIPRTFIDMTFNDGTGKVVLPVPSQKVKINCKPDSGASPVRQMSQLRITQIANAQKLLEENGYVELRVSAEARGLIPGIDAMLDLAVPGFAAPVITEAEGPFVDKFRLEDGRFFVESRRGWVIHYRPDESLDREQPVFSFPQLKPAYVERAGHTRSEEVRLEKDRQQQLGISEPGLVRQVEELFTPRLVTKVQRDMNDEVVPAGEPVALNPQDIPEVPVSPWRYVAMGLVGVLVVAGGIVWMARRRRKEDVEGHGHVLAMPDNVDGFSILCLLRAIGTDPALSLSDGERAELADDIRMIERSSFRPGAEPSVPDLTAIGEKWLKLALS